MPLKTIDELKKIAKAGDERSKAHTGRPKIWGNQDIPPLPPVLGPVLYEDTFANLNAWHHEGIGELTQPEADIMQLNCVGSKQGAAGCMAFCRQDFPDSICIEYEMRALTNRGLLITFIAAQGRQGEDMITELPAREGIFADYILNPRLHCYHVSISRYDDKGIRLALNGKGVGQIRITDGKFPVKDTIKYRSVIGGKSEAIEPDYGQITMPIDIDGEMEVRIRCGG